MSCECPFCRQLTVFGFGLHRAVLWTLGDQCGAEEVGAALQLQAHFAAEVGDLIGHADETNGRSVGFPFVPETEDNSATLSATSPQRAIRTLFMEGTKND